MRRLGKSQQLQRRFRFFIVGYVIGETDLTQTIEITLFTLENFNSAAIWPTFVVFCGMCTVMLSMAEMASMAPTSGGETKIVADLHAVADTKNCQDNITGYPNSLLAACKSSSHSLSVGFVL